MRRQFLLAVSGVLAVCTTWWMASPAMPTGTIFKEWKAMYVHAGASNGKARNLADAVDKAKCSVCHGKKGKPSAKNFNSYGRNLSHKLAKGDAKDAQKLHEAFAKVAKMVLPEGNCSYSKTLTYGDRIARQGKLPATVD
jgi:hypothetical protein